MDNRRASETGRVDAPASECFLTEIVELQAFLWQQAICLVRDQADADDLVQDTVERALSCRHLFRAGTNLKGWTRSIMRNLFIDGWRRAPVCVAVDPDQLAAAASPPAVFDEPGPLDVFRMEDVRAAAAQLRGRDRDLFNLAHLQKLPYRQIATRFGMRVDTLGTRLFRIRQQIRKILERSLEQGTGSCLPLPARPASTGMLRRGRPTKREPRLTPCAA